MIVPVDKANAREWARMCVALHGHDDIAHFLAEMEAENEEHFLYELDGRYIGLMDLSLRSDYVEGAETRPAGYIEGIYIEPDFRGRGIAKEFIEFAKEWSQNKGAKELASDAPIHNTESIAFHMAVGFEEAGRNVHFVMRLNEADPISKP